MAKNASKPMAFQKALREAEDVTTQLFELANTDVVRYTTKSGANVDIRQDRNNNTHTGGIVWETAFLLALYLENHILEDRALKKGSRLKVLELGAGCGLLGLVVAHNGHQVTLTEHPAALDNLKDNVASNTKALPSTGKAIAAQLTWGVSDDIVALQKAVSATFDMILGTDVVYQAELVEPLLQTICTLSHDETVVWLCLQERCAKAHQVLLKLMPTYYDTVEEYLPSDLPPGLEFAEELECKIYKLTGKKTL